MKYGNYETVSDCCGTSPRQYEDSGDDDWGFCSQCRDHCEYIKVCADCGEEPEFDNDTGKLICKISNCDSEGYIIC